jgi:phosphate transport system substrate-binding protein
MLMRMKSKLGPASVGLTVVLLAALVMAGCGSSLSGTVTLSGSTTVQPLAQEAADEFTKTNSKVTVTVQGGGSSVGITQVSEGTVNIGMSSRELKDNEKNLGLVDHQIAYDVIVMIVNPDVTITNLTTDQVKGIFTGKITNWNQVGGANETITVVIRDSSSGTREMFDQTALGSTTAAPVKLVPGAIETNSSGVMRQKVASTKGSIGYISNGYLNSSVKPIQFNGVTGNLTNGLNKTYPLARYLHMFTKGAATGAAKSYIDFVLSPDFQNTTVAKQYIPMSKVNPSSTTK